LNFWGGKKKKWIYGGNRSITRNVLAHCHPEQSEGSKRFCVFMREYNYYIYILASSNNQVLYIGVTNNLSRRLSEHKQKLVNGFTEKYKCKKLVYYENFSDINQAIAREKYLKGKNRKFKEDLINSINIDWKDLSDEWT